VVGLRLEGNPVGEELFNAYCIDNNNYMIHNSNNDNNVGLAVVAWWNYGGNHANWMSGLEEHSTTCVVLHVVGYVVLY